MPFLPEEIIREILHRLPVKSLLRFRSVSKLWRRLIDGRGFIQMHLRHSLRSNSNRTLLVDSCRLYYVDLDSFELLEVGDDAQIEPHSVMATCDGLVLLVPTFGDISLWNPAMRKQRVLPAHPPTPYHFFCLEFVESFFSLGYDADHDDYKVVRVVQAEDDGDGGGFLTETMIYSLKENCWKRGKDFPYLLPHHTSRWGIYLNGSLHTVVMFCCNHEALMAFDLGKEEHRQLPMPAYRSPGDDPSFASVEVLGGCLALVVSGEKSTAIWLMKEYGVKQSWMKLLRFDRPIRPYMKKNLRPLVYSKNGEEVLLNDEGMCLNWYNLREKTVTIPCVSGLSASFNTTDDEPLFDVEVCVGSLVSPFSPSGKEAKKKENSRKENSKKENSKKEINRKRDYFLSTGFKLKL